MFMTNKFLSPIANGAPIFYRYFIIDTLLVDNVNCFKLLFEPRNRSDSFLKIPLCYPGQQLCNQKDRYGIEQSYKCWLVKRCQNCPGFALVQKKNLDAYKERNFNEFWNNKNSLGVFGQRTVSYADYAINEAIPDTVFRVKP